MLMFHYAGMSNTWQANKGGSPVTIRRDRGNKIN